MRGLAFVLAVALGGCANFTAKITGTSRAGTEQLLLTGASDRAVACIDFRQLTGARVYLDDSRVAAADKEWLTFSLRRAMARQGLLLVDEKKEAHVVVEAAVAAYGTDEVNCGLSTPGMSSGLLPLIPATSPSALSIKNRQDAVVKLALIAFDAGSRRLVWESGTVFKAESLDRRFFGTNEVSRSSTLPVFDDYPRRR